MVFGVEEAARAEEELEVLMVAATGVVAATVRVVKVVATATAKAVVGMVGMVVGGRGGRGVTTVGAVRMATVDTEAVVPAVALKAAVPMEDQSSRHSSKTPMRRELNRATWPESRPNPPIRQE